MSRHEIITFVCDHCLSAHERGSVEIEAVETVTLGFNREQRRSVDLCEEHAELYRVIKGVVRSRGREA